LKGRAQIRIKFHRFCRMTASYKEFISEDSQGHMQKPGALAEKWGIIFEGSLEVKLPTIWTVEKQR